MPTWITPAGHLFTATEMVAVFTGLAAIGTGTTFTKISGELPDGLTLLSPGFITGVPNYVLELTTKTFTVRATDIAGFQDRTFSIDVVGGDTPIWDTYTITTSTVGTLTTSTGTGYLGIGLNGEPYALYRQWVDYQLKAHTVEAPSTATIKFFIADGDGVLPLGLNLDRSGRIYGFVNIPVPVGSTPEAYCFDNIYDSVTEYNSAATTASILVTEGFRINSVYITATDGVRGNKRLFKFLTLNPDIFKASSPFLPTYIDVLNLSLLPASSSYIQTPQFIKPSNLGKFKVGNNVYLQADAYDPAPITGPVVYSINQSRGTLIQLPGTLSLNTSTGFITGNVKDQNSYIQNYNVTIDATKYGIATNEIITATNTFTFTILNGITGNIEWINTGSLGSLITNEVSEFYVKAVSDKPILLKYEVSSGALPPGLVMNRDGTISGKVPNNNSVSSTSTNYTFGVSVLDNNNNLFTSANFSITVNQTTSTDFTNVWVKPHLPLPERSNYNKLISNFDIFQDDFIYRPLDPNFGIQKNMKMFIEFGAEKENLSTYITTISQNFNRRKFHLGEVKSAVRKLNSSVIYELIYIEVIDNLVNNNQESVSQSFTYNNVTYYPTSVDNMRKRIANMHEVTNKLDPKFMKTIQPGALKSLGFIRYIPISFVLPGYSSIIIRKIKDSGFKFNHLDFEIDRIFIEKPSNYPDVQYILFPR